MRMRTVVASGSQSVGSLLSALDRDLFVRMSTVILESGSKKGHALKD